MRSYANVQEQRRIVQKVLGKNPSCEWSFAKRQVGAHMDTDFCVIEGCSALREELRGSKAILDVHEDHAGKRHLKGEVGIETVSSFPTSMGASLRAQCRQKMEA